MFSFTIQKNLGKTNTLNHANLNSENNRVMATASDLFSSFCCPKRAVQSEQKHNIQTLPSDLIRQIGHFAGADINNLSKTSKILYSRVREAMTVPAFQPSASCNNLFVSPNGNMYSTKKLTNQVFNRGMDPRQIFHQELQKILPNKPRLQILMAEKPNLDRYIQLFLLGCNNAIAMLKMAQNDSTLPFILSNLFRLAVGPHDLTNEIRYAVILHPKTDLRLFRTLNMEHVTDLMNEEQTPPNVLSKISELQRQLQA